MNAAQSLCRRGLWLLLLGSLAYVPSLWAQLPPLAQAFFPEADRITEFSGKPPVAKLYRAGELIGYVFRSADMVRIPAYSGQPINVLIGMEVTGKIRGARIIEHVEPILLAGVSEQQLAEFIQQYRGKRADQRLRVGGAGLDTISGATITVMVANATIVQSARKVLAAQRRVIANSQPRAPATKKTETAVSSKTPASSEATATSPPETQTVSTQPPPAMDSESGDTAATEAALWHSAWQAKRFQLVILVAGLLLLTIIVIFQDMFALRPRLLAWLRTGFLLYTLVFIGWYALAQLSVMNVFVFLRALMQDFHWDSFLLDPLVFVLWTYVAVTLLLFGRGIYCGWLCPFGALQELLNKLARWLRIKQWELPELVHERLWALKYIILLALFGLSLPGSEHIGSAIEIEPFKTAISMHFGREWPFVLYALSLLLIGLVSHKFFCRYLCPLGAALTLPGKYRLFNWLRRRKECGTSCDVCAQACQIRAIPSSGEINMNECHYCLDCQVIYWDKNTCPPLLERHTRRRK